MTPDLKPCPFCGRKAVKITWFTPEKKPLYQVLCRNPDCIQPATNYDTDEAVVKQAWNRRVSDEKDA